jgi:Protein of unknown function (DUF1612)
MGVRDGREGDARLAAWQALVGAKRDLPPLLAAAVLWDASEASQPLRQRLARLVPALPRARQKTKAHLLGLNAALIDSKRRIVAAAATVRVADSGSWDLSRIFASRRI